MTKAQAKVLREMRAGGKVRAYYSPGGHRRIIEEGMSRSTRVATLEALVRSGHLELQQRSSRWAPDNHYLLTDLGKSCDLPEEEVEQTTTIYYLKDGKPVGLEVAEKAKTYVQTGDGYKPRIDRVENPEKGLIARDGRFGDGPYFTTPRLCVAWHMKETEKRIARLTDDLQAEKDRLKALTVTLSGVQ